MEQGYYVVVGSFHIFENAQRFSDHIDLLGYESRYGYSASTGFFYVYLTFNDQYQAASVKCNTIKNLSLFNDAWVLNVVPGDSRGGMLAKDDQESIIDNESDITGHEIRVGDDTISPDQVPSKLNNETGTVPPNVEAQTGVTSQAEATTEEDHREDKKNNSTRPEGKFNAMGESEDAPASGDGFNYYFNVVDARTFKEVPATIMVIDPVREKLLRKVEAHKNYLINDPNNGRSAVQFISNSIGYKKIQFDLALDNPPKMEPTDKTWQMGDTTLLDFQVHRLEKGDIQVMYNVFFFNNSAVMRPESKFELKQMVAMMNENPAYEVQIHGHTNGNAFGPIIKMQDDDDNFFELSSENEEKNGSAKKLSQERADIIKRYLVSQGVESKRLKTKGWGGKKMIYKLNHPDSHRNARVEIEILKD